MAKENNFVNDFFKLIKDEDTLIAAGGDSAAEFGNYIDTGCYALNALLSGSIYGGFADNKRLAIAGPSATGKSFFALSIVEQFLEKYEEGFVFYIDTEAAITRQMLSDRNIDPNRVIIFQVNTVEKLRTKIMQFTEKHVEFTKKNPKSKALIVLDSLGNTSTEKEVADISSGATTRDMTRGQLIRGMFRAITVPLARAKIPVIVNNHTYENVTNPYAGPSMSGGDGLRYAGDVIIYLSKAKERDSDKQLVGSIITARLFKSRLTKEGASVKLRLSYSSGLDKYYGLLDIGIELGVFKKVSTKVQLPDGRTLFGKVIENNPEKYFTKEILDQIDKGIPSLYCYGEDELVPDDDEVEEDDFGAGELIID